MVVNICVRPQYMQSDFCKLIIIANALCSEYSKTNLLCIEVFYPIEQGHSHFGRIINRLIFCPR